MKNIHQTLASHILDKSFPCIGAKAAVTKNEIYSFSAGSIFDHKYDKEILHFLYSFIEIFRNEGSDFYSASVLFTDKKILSEDEFEKAMWERLQAISDLDARNYPYDTRVKSDTLSPDFSYSIKEESFFILGMHPGSSRPARQLELPALIFNPHQQFEEMRQSGKYDTMKKSIRKKDILLAGKINPMLRDHGTDSEVWQYSGKNYTEKVECPFKAHHQK